MLPENFLKIWLDLADIFTELKNSTGVMAEERESLITLDWLNLSVYMEFHIVDHLLVWKSILYKLTNWNSGFRMKKTNFDFGTPPEGKLSDYKYIIKHIN